MRSSDVQIDSRYWVRYRRPRGGETAALGTVIHCYRYTHCAACARWLTRFVIRLDDGQIKDRTARDILWAEGDNYEL
jgi:hypothetical protein